MKFFRSKQDYRLDQAISELRAEQPDAKTLSASAEHVWQKLQAGLGEDAATSALQPIRGCADIRALAAGFSSTRTARGSRAHRGTPFEGMRFLPFVCSRPRGRC